MLIRYKKDFEKIAMGLLSFIPELKDVKVLLEVIKEYEENPQKQLYLWREEDVLGAIGVKFNEDQAVINHIAVNPSFRNVGIGEKMISELKDLYEGDLQVMPSEEVKSFYKRCFSLDNSK